MNNNTLGERIVELLEKNRMSQRTLADLSGNTEISISRYISGARVPKGPVIVKIAAALHTTTDYLLGMDLEKAMDEVEDMASSDMFNKCYDNDLKSIGALEIVREAIGYRIAEPVKYIGEYAVCPKCNKVVGSKAKFCKECGQRVVREE